MRKHYEKIEDFFKELSDEANADVPVGVMAFWGAIDAYSEARYDQGSEGNSGEFHDDEEAERLKKAFVMCETALFDVFATNTGYRPRFVNIGHQVIHVGKYKNHNVYGGYWVFDKV